MSASNGYITRLCELAFQAYGRSVGLGVIPNASILAGFDDADIMTPRLIFNCDNAEPEGNWDEVVWNCQLEIQCVSNCDDTTKEAHHDFAAEVFSQFMVGRYTLPDLVTAAALANNPPVQFFCQDVLCGSQIKTVSERRWISSLILKVSCCSAGAASEDGEQEPAFQGILDEGGSQILDEGGGVILGE